jgi:phosphatidylserine/phosphatidylglycerophosphate/cardiolipin synthase-like enzyme
MEFFKKFIAVAILIATFLLFLFVQMQKSEKYTVVKIISPVKIMVSNSKHANKMVLVKNVQSFIVKPDKNQLKLAKKLHLSEEETIELGYLAGNFAQSKLTNQKIVLDKKIDTSAKVITSDVSVNNQNYGKMLTDNGFAVDNNLKITTQMKKNIQKAQKLNLRIFNNKSHKYHKLTCKYGLMAHNILILPQSQIPKDAKPCGWCLKHHKHFKHYKHRKHNFDDMAWKSAWTDFSKIPYVKTPPEIYKTDNIEMFLTDMTTIRKPNNKCQTSVCKALVNEINSAQTSIDFAIYGYTKIPDIQNALKAAQNRGVLVRFVYDMDRNSSNIYPDTFYLANLFQNHNTDFSVSKRSKSKYQSAIMHNKFFIFDKSTVFTGSANISNTDMSGFNSNVAVILRSPKIAKIYEREFNQMYMGKFHRSKRKLTKKQPIIVGNSEISVFFSPKDRTIENQIIPLIDSAQKYIYMPAFLISHKELLHHLVAARHRGVSVMVILDATNAHGKNPKHMWLRKNGIPVKTENFAGKLHSKTILIDDTYTIIGSMNFSRSGDRSNDENLLIIKDREVTLFYKKFFFYLWKRIPDYWLKHNAMAESPYSIGSCSDGIDNDFDGKIDKADPSCKPIVHKKYHNKNKKR